MNERIAFSLLKKSYHYNKLLLKHDHIIRTDELGFDVVDEAFDLLGLPPEDDNFESPGFFNRDYLYDGLYEMKDGTDDEIQSFMEYAKSEAARIKEEDKKALDNNPDSGRHGR